MSKHLTPKQAVAHLKKVIESWPSDVSVEASPSKLILSWLDYQGKTHKEVIELPRRINITWNKNLM